MLVVERHLLVEEVRDGVDEPLAVVGRAVVEHVKARLVDDAVFRGSFSLATCFSLEAALAWRVGTSR